MTHVQSIWKAVEIYQKHADIHEEEVKKLMTWSRSNLEKIPEHVSEEQLILFLHACYNNVENAKKCMLAYYSLRRKGKQFFQKRNVELPELQYALKVLYYGIIKPFTPQGYKIIFHCLKSHEPSAYNFNLGFRLLCMAMDAMYIRTGPVQGCILLFDLTGVKFGHIARLPLGSIKKVMDYIQYGNPIRLKAIHVLNCHPIIDKIMTMIKPFIQAELLEILHFHKEEEDTITDYIPKECLPSNYYGGLADSVEAMHEEFLAEMKNLHPLFVTEDEHLLENFYKRKSGSKKNQSGPEEEPEIDLVHLEID